MMRTSDLRILLATNFSDACFRTSAAIAQLADRCHINLTIAHVARPGSVTIHTRRELDSFLAEADSYDNTRRVLVEADDAAEAIANLCDAGGYDVVISPAADRVGFHRFFNASTRGKLLKRCPAPLWTFGHCLDRAVFKPSIQTIGCLLNFDHPSDRHIHLAAALAARIGAKMRIMTVVPHTDEGTLAQSLYAQGPLVPEIALERIQNEFAGRACPEVDVAVGDMKTQLPRMINRTLTDLLVVGPGQALHGVVNPKPASWIDQLPCPALCIDGGSAAFPSWTFQRASEERFANPQRSALAS